MIRRAVERAWAEPCAPSVPARVWRDYALLAVLLTSAVLEAALRPDLVWRPFVLVLTIALSFSVLWRRTHPLAVTVVVFGSSMALSLVAIEADVDESVGLYTMVFILVLLYSLYRWGSGRDVLIGSLLVVGTFTLGMVEAPPADAGEAIAGLVFGSFPAVLGLAVRLVTTSRERELDQVRLRERELLARDLHDTVAHHVSAMVIRAQAGQVLAGSYPEAAQEALAVIEAEGSRTLAEMRAMVGALRSDGDADLAPQRGVADIERLARDLGGDLGGNAAVEVRLSGDLDDIGPSVGAAVYRIAQESITNAVRHARGASRIVVQVTGEDRFVRFTVTDDGESVSASRAPAGYGVVGMTERATLLGGTIDIGPGPGRGWVVDAVLPKAGAAR